MGSLTGAQIIARSLQDLGVTTVFGIVGIPVVEVAEAAIDLGIRFIGFRNEQAASYAATAFGYLTGTPGVCLVVGGPGVLHAMAWIGNANANAFPLLLLAGSSETHAVSKGAFQELDAISLLSSHTKLAVRPPSLESIPRAIQDAYKTAWFGRPGPTFVDLPADIIQSKIESEEVEHSQPISAAPVGGADELRLAKIAKLIKSAKAPLIILGKGAAYSKAEDCIRDLINKTSLPFLPSPMGKGIVADSHPANTASARSTALRQADVVLLLGARLNWIFHFGEAPKWNPSAKFIQVDISQEELGRNSGDPDLGIVGDIATVIPQLQHHLDNWQYDKSSSYVRAISESRKKNEEKAANLASRPVQPLSLPRAYHIIKETLHSYAPPEEGSVVYVTEGANTMDQSRSAFPVEHPRLRLDAGTYATMGVGLGYAIAAHEAYNSPIATEPLAKSGKPGRKKIVCFEGDSAFGFSGLEVETMARYGMDILIFVMNNGGVYHGDSDNQDEWNEAQKNTVSGRKLEAGEPQLRSSTLGYNVRYEQMAEMCGGKGYFARTEEELRTATEEGFEAKVPVVVNVAIQSGKGAKLEFGWQASAKAKKSAKL